MLVEVVLFVGVLLLLWQALKKPTNYPPGRWGLPLIGYIPLPGPTIEDHLWSLHKKHGDIYLWRIGTQVMVFIHNYQLLRDALNRPEFTDRPDWEIYLTSQPEALGVVSSNNAIWHNNRRFSLRQLRDLGMGKSRLVEAVQRQAMLLAEILAKQAGKPAPVPQALKVAIVNVIWQLVGSKQFEVDNPKLIELENITKTLLDAEYMITIQDVFPWLKYLMPSFLFRRLVRQDTMDDTMQKFIEYFSEEIDEHNANLTSGGDARDVIEGYLMEMERKKDDPNSTFNKKDLAILVINLFLAGSETTTSTLTWMIYYLATHPHVQEKLQAEIDLVLPDGCQATLDDRARLPYTEAVIHETLRKSSLVPNSLHHVANRETTLGGYIIPKGAIINSAIFTIHHDPRYWNSPDVFLPERWLDQEGKFVSKKEGFIPFGIGKRQCLGESLARMELLIFATTLLQRLSFNTPPGKTVSLHHDTVNPFFHFPPSQDILISVRSQRK